MNKTTVVRIDSDYAKQLEAQRKLLEAQLNKQLSLSKATGILAGKPTINKPGRPTQKHKPLDLLDL